MKNLVIIFIFLISSSSFAQKTQEEFNLLISPVLPLVGIVQAELNYKVSPQWVLGPSVVYLNWSLFDLKIKGSSLALSGRYYFGEAYQDSWYGNGKVGLTKVDVSSVSSGSTYSSSASRAFLSLGGGYHWFWETANLNLGLIASKDSGGVVEVRDESGRVIDSYSPVTFGMEFLLGITF